MTKQTMKLFLVIHTQRVFFLWLLLLGLAGILLAIAVLTNGCALTTDPPGSVDSTTSRDIPFYGYKIVNIHPHDRNAFTQGLTFENGFLYEGTGLRGHSTLRRVELETGNILKTRQLAEQLFGEGITIYKNQIIQLTWQSNTGFVYDKESFELLQKFNYSTEGWGITYDGKHLIMSDGTSTLYYLDPETFSEIGRITVSDDNGPVSRLNELEYVQGEIYANVWLTDYIVRISPVTGHVIGWVNLKGILSSEDRDEVIDVLNGIAYDAQNDRLFITGKLWPKVFEIILTPPHQ